MHTEDTTRSRRLLLQTGIRNDKAAVRRQTGTTIHAAEYARSSGRNASIAFHRAEFAASSEMAPMGKYTRVCRKNIVKASRADRRAPQVRTSTVATTGPYRPKVGRASLELAPEGVPVMEVIIFSLCENGLPPHMSALSLF